MNQYSSIVKSNNKLSILYYDTETRAKKISEIKNIKDLCLYRYTKNPSEYKSLIGNYNLEKISFDSISEYNDYVNQYSDVNGMDIYGEFPIDKKWSHGYYKEEIAFDYTLLNIGYFDIETTVTENSQPDVNNTPERITSMVLYATKSNKYYIFCDKKITGKYFTEDDLKESQIEFFYYTPDEDGEYKMLKEFAHIINDVEHLDVLSAYFGNLFDYPYVFNRISKLVRLRQLNYDKKDSFNERNLSPIKSAYRTQKGQVYIQGLQCLDYFELYKKYKQGSPESWKLDFIASKELGVGKLKLEGGFMYVYNNNYEQYVYYNYIDVKRLKEIDEKLNFMALHAEISYLAKQNFEDTISPVKTWESLIYGFLNSKKIILNPVKENSKKKYLGAYTHEPIAEFYNYILSFDLNSLYPHLIMAYYMSPETIISEKEILSIFPDNESLKSILIMKKELEQVSNMLPYDKVAVAKVYDAVADKIINRELDLSFLQGTDITMTPSLEFFRKKEGAVLPYFMEHFYDMRKVVKKKMLIMKDDIQILKKLKNKKNEVEKLKEKYEELKNLDKIGDIIAKMESLAKIWGLKEKAFKILLNSAYGAFGNNYFRLFDLRIAKGITSSGRLAIRSLIKAIENKLRDFYKDFAGKDWTGSDFFIYSDTDSCAGDSVLNIFDENGNLEKITIENLYLRLGGKLETEIDKIKLETNNIQTPSLNTKSSEIEMKNINYIWKHLVDKEMFKIKCGDNEVIVTEDHSIIIERNNKYISVKPRDIIKGDKLIEIVGV